MLNWCGISIDCYMIYVYVFGRILSNIDTVSIRVHVNKMMAHWSSWYNLGWRAWSRNRSSAPRKRVQRLPRLNLLQRLSPHFESFPKPVIQCFSTSFQFPWPMHPNAPTVDITKISWSLMLPLLAPFSLRNLLKMVTKNDEWSWGLESGGSLPVARDGCWCAVLWILVTF